jgi:hypothetical protein
LTDQELLSVPDQAGRLERVLGRPVNTVDVPLDVTRTQMLASGMDSSVVDVIVTGSAWVWAGQHAILTDDVARVLHRPPASYEAWARDHRESAGVAVFAVGRLHIELPAPGTDEGAATYRDLVAPAPAAPSSPRVRLDKLLSRGHMGLIFNLAGAVS